MTVWTKTWEDLKEENEVLLADVAKLEVEVRVRDSAGESLVGLVLQLQAQLERSKQQTRDSIAVSGEWEKGFEAMKAKLQASEAGAAALREALVKVTGLHDDRCVVARCLGDVCSCGRDEAVRVLKANPAGADMLAEVERLRRNVRDSDALLGAAIERADKAEKELSDVNHSAEVLRTLVLKAEKERDEARAELKIAWDDTGEFEAGFNECREAAAEEAALYKDNAPDLADSIRTLKPEPKAAKPCLRCGGVHAQPCEFKWNNNTKEQT